MAEAKTIIELSLDASLAKALLAEIEALAARVSSLEGQHVTLMAYGESDDASEPDSLDEEIYNAALQSARDRVTNQDPSSRPWLTIDQAQKEELIRALHHARTRGSCGT